MNLAQEAKEAAEAVYPKTDAVALMNPSGETVALLVAGRATHAMSRTPYAIGYLTGYAAALADLPAALNRVMCTVCEGDGEFIQSPTGSWWAHENHPADHHDYAPGLRP